MMTIVISDSNSKLNYVQNVHLVNRMTLCFLFFVFFMTERLWNP